MHWWCPICTELLNDIKTTSVTPCGHVFHMECLMKWMIESETCPHCRQSVSPSLLVKLYPDVISCKEITSIENNSDFNAQRKVRVSKLWEFTCRSFKVIKQSKANTSALLRDKCILREQMEKCIVLASQQNAFIKSLESKIANLEEINRQLNFENEHLNDVKTIVNGTRLEAEKVLSRCSSNAGEENAAKQLASYCSILKCELDRVVGGEKALEFNFQEVGYKYSNENSKLTQLQKLVEKFKKDISLLETEKKDSSGYDYSKDTPSCYDEQAISMRDNITENGVDYSPNTKKFAENEQQISVKIVEDEMPTASKLSVFNSKEVVLSSSSSLACQDDSITRIGYDERPSVENRTFRENLPNHLIDKKRKSTFSCCESPMPKRKINN